MTQVCADAVVACDAARAVSRLAQALDAPATVGPRRTALLHKQVLAHVGPPSPRRWTSVSRMRWTPMGRGAGLFPVLHAALAVTAIDETSCLLTVAGEYVPPLGRVGAVMDRAGLQRVAASTLDNFAGAIARALAQESKEAPR